MSRPQNHYETLELGVSASADDIQTAYERLLNRLTSPAYGLDRGEAGRRLAVVNQAYWILSDQARRNGYDAMLVSRNDPVQFSVEVREERWTLQKVLFTLIGGTIALGLVSQIVIMLYLGYLSRYGIEDGVQTQKSPETIRAQEEAAEEKRLDAEAYKQELDRRNAASKSEREREENRRYADQVSSNLRAAEEQAKREAERERQRAEQDERARAEEERRRIQDQKRDWQRELGRY